jgi:rRNA maturation RNase YbeY
MASGTKLSQAGLISLYLGLNFMARISFAYQSAYRGPESKGRLRDFLVWLAGREGYGIDELNFVICSDKFLLQINQAYLSHDYYTDIITFDLRETAGAIKGEIYISLDRVRENAKTWNQPVYKELHRVIFHGLLHLCGYKDTLKADQVLMRQKEDFYLEEYFRR